MVRVHRFQRWIRRILSLALFITGAAWLFNRRSQRRVRILLYHKVNDRHEDALSIAVSDFEAQMVFLSRYYRLTSLDDMMAAFLAGKRLPSRSVVVTFDDGYEDNYTQALPILVKYGIPATVFLVHDYVNTDRTYPWDGETMDHALTWDQIAHMQTRGVTFGCHTLSHPLLSQIPHEQVGHEIRESKQRLERFVGPMRFFAYPRGERRDFSEEIKAIVKKEGFLAACSTIPGTNDLDSDWFELRRTAVEPVDASHVGFRLLMMGVTDVVLGLFRHGWAKEWFSKPEWPSYSDPA
jgi:peptidoglycan/xylan/chitin deacetylase (PgdA/CDA1 family)